MPKINVQQVLANAAIESSQPKSSPIIKLGSKEIRPTLSSGYKSIPPSDKNKVTSTNPTVQILEREYNHIRLDRSKLSTLIAKMVENKETSDKLAAHYERIEAYRPVLKELHEKIEYVKINGQLPEVKVESHAGEEPSVEALKLEKKKLIDLRYKLGKKIKLAKAKNPNRITTWQVELEKADAQYNELDRKIKGVGK